MTDLPVAAENVLNFVRCKCKSDRNRCGGNNCSCRKNGLKCVEVCSGCKGNECENREAIDLNDVTDDEEDIDV